MSIEKDFSEELLKIADKDYAEKCKMFFKTGLGGYSEKDIFIGIRVPILRSFVKNYTSMELSQITSLLKSEIHEIRLGALLLLVQLYKKSSTEDKETIYKTYLMNTQYVNNWDLVDLSCPKIVGEHLLTSDDKDLHKLSISTNMWERRIAIISTLEFVRNKRYDSSLELAGVLLHDTHDLIHKAVGWVLREVGKKDITLLENFLKPVYNQMPRTMLRYAIERMTPEVRTAYLKGRV